jgi:uncharacterized DUF497 family protein
MWEGFEWDQVKALVNARKHGVTFFEAKTAFDDPFSLTLSDPDHSAHEERFILIGATTFDKIVVVAHVLRGENIRIISARPADSGERRTYEEA